MILDQAGTRISFGIKKSLILSYNRIYMVLSGTFNNLPIPSYSAFQWLARILFPHAYAIFVVFADGGKRDSSVEKNGDQCDGGREENREEHGQHAGNLYCLPHRNTVGHKLEHPVFYCGFFSPTDTSFTAICKRFKRGNKKHNGHN